MNPSTRLEDTPENLPLKRRVDSYKECCYRAYGAGIASLSIASSISFFALKRLYIKTNTVMVVSGCIGAVAGYYTTKEAVLPCNQMLRYHLESLKSQTSG